MAKKKDGEENGDVLWQEAVRDVAPLRAAAKISAGRKDGPALKSSSPPPAPLPSPERTALPQPSGTEPNPGLDRRTAERLRRGQMPVEARLDLHGHSRIRAYEALGRFIAGAYGSGLRCVLVITGKGGGVLRAGVPEWLAEPSLRGMILKTATARPEHGGEGALYVLLRRRR